MTTHGAGTPAERTGHAAEHSLVASGAPSPQGLAAQCSRPWEGGVRVGRAHPPTTGAPGA